MSKRNGIIILLVVTIYYILIATIIYNYSFKNETQNADVAIVLGAGIEDSIPSPIFKERINHSIYLYENGYVEKIIFTGGKTEKNKLSEASVAKKYAESQGIQSQDILIEEQSKITYENLKFAKELMKENKLNSALIISDPLHMKRAMLMAKDLNLKSYSSPTKTSKFKSIDKKLKFLMRETFFYILYQFYRLF